MKTYVSDPRLWKAFYKDLFEGKLKPSSKKNYRIPVDTTGQDAETVVVGKRVTPIEIVEDRAKSDLQHSIDEDIPHISAGIKADPSLYPASMKSTRKRTRPPTRKRRGVQTGKGRKSKLPPKRKPKKRKRVTKNVFSKK